MATRVEIGKFDGTKFGLWKLKMKAVLVKDNCLEAIGIRPAEFTDDEKWKRIDAMALSNLHLGLSDDILSGVEEKETAKEVWDHLIKLYEAKSLHNKIFLKRKLYTLRMSESTSVTEHIHALTSLCSQLATLGHNISPQERAEILLQSLPDSYDQLIINLTANILTDSLVFDDVAASVLEEENRRRSKEDRQASSQQAEALSITRGRSTERDSSGSHNQGRRSKSRSKKNFKCYKCGKRGHFKNECRSKGVDTTGTSQGYVAEGDILYSKAATGSRDRSELTDAWILDSGATWHMTSRRDWFHTYEPISVGSVYMGNDHALEIAGIGSIKVKMYDGMVRTIQNVRHVKGLKKNLLSLGQLDEIGCVTRIHNGMMRVVKGALVVMKAERMVANLYRLMGETCLEADVSVATTSSAEDVTKL